MRCPYCQDQHPAGTYVCPKTQQRLTGILAEGTEVDGKYRVLGILGTGGMAAVYRAEHVKIGRTVALKLLLPEFIAYPELVTRVEREARAAGGIDHPNVVEIVDLGSTPQYGPYIAMEMLKGSDLATFVENRGGKLPPFEAVEITRQVLGALAAAHAKGVVHRDLKPENIFLSEDEDRLRIKVLDFGISKLAVEGQGLNSLTRTGTVLGTPQFMAPEQAAGARDQDLRVDLYACGVVLYAILTGQLPYEAENYNLLINEILNKPPKPILTRDPTLDPGLADAVMHSLSRRPEDRYQTAKEMQDALVSWLEANEVEDPSGLLRRVGTAPTVSITGRQTGQRRPSASARAPSGAGASAPRPPSPTVPTRRPSQPRADGPVDDDEPTTSIEVPVEPPSAALRSNTHTPLGWENTPAGVNLPRPKSRAPLVAAAAGAVLLLAGSALAMRLFAPSGWNSVVRSVGLGGLAVGPSPTPPASRTTHAAATGASHSSGASSHSHTPPANTVASTPDAGATSEHGSADAGTSAANSSAHAPEPVHTTAPTHPVHPGGTRNAHPAPHHPAPHHPVHHPAGRTHHR